jgi:hypothetical protein
MVGEKVHFLFLTLAIDGDEWSPSWPATLLSMQVEEEAGSALEPVWAFWRKQEFVAPFW